MMSNRKHVLVTWRGSQEWPGQLPGHDGFGAPAIMSSKQRIPLEFLQTLS